jgi:hypothetical protein
MHGVTAGIASVWTHDGAGCSWQMAIMALSNVESGGTGRGFRMLARVGSAHRAAAACPASS